MRIVLDTNVLISGLMNPHGVPGRILDSLLSGKLSLLYDDRILSEYRDVLKRPHLGIEVSLAQAVLSYIRLSGEQVSAELLPVELLPDPDDLAFAEVAFTGGADALVTGNLKHFKGVEKVGVKLFSPAEFLENMQ
jgi:uncharacterized protein